MVPEIIVVEDGGKNVIEATRRLWKKFHDTAIKTDSHNWRIPLVSEIGAQKVYISYRNDFVKKIPSEMPGTGVGLYIFVDSSTALGATEVTCLLSNKNPFVRIMGVKIPNLNFTNPQEAAVIFKTGSELLENDTTLLINQIKIAISGDFKLDQVEK